MRTNERAAAALGISVPGAKLYAFALSAGIAALGGILLVFRLSSDQTTQTFTNFTSITDVGLALIGGIGYLIGPVIGATLTDGGLNAADPRRRSSRTRSASTSTLIGGVSILIIVLLNQNGIAKEGIAQVDAGPLASSRAVPFLGPREPPVRPGARARRRRPRGRRARSRSAT